MFGGGGGSVGGRELKLGTSHEGKRADLGGVQCTVVLFVARTDEIRGESRKLQNEEHRDLYFLSFIIT
jgi:hypothetical protein